MVGHAQRTDVDQLPDAVFPAGADHVPCAPDRARLEVPGRSAHARADVVDRLDAAHGMGNDVRIAEVATDHLDIVALASRRWRAPDPDPAGRPTGPARPQPGASAAPVRPGAQAGPASKSPADPRMLAPTW